MARPSKANGWKRVLAEHPLGPHSSDPNFWQPYLEANPHVLHKLLADVFRMTYGADRPPTLDDLWALVEQPKPSTEPFPDAFREAQGTRSMSSIAQRAGLHPTTLLRHLNGERPIISVNDPAGSMRRLEIIAVALEVHPSYFAEWRRLWIMCLLDEAFSGRPDLSVGVYQRFSSVSQRENARSRVG